MNELSLSKKPSLRKKKQQIVWHEWYIKNRNHRQTYCRQYYKEHPEAYGNKTRTSLHWRATGYIQYHQELIGTKCELCDSEKYLCGHHLDYSYPEVIVTLCTSCHNWIHKGINHGN